MPSAHQADRGLPAISPTHSEIGTQEALQALLESRNLRQVDLLPIFDSRSRVSDAVSGKREISKSQARKLGEFFSVSPDLFICEGDLLKAHPRLKVEHLRAALLYAAPLIDLETTVTP